MTPFNRARDTGEAALHQLAFEFRSRAQHRVRRSLGVRGAPPPPCTDSELSYLPVDGAARYVHGDLASMLVGGLSSLLLQMLHPLAMTGVAQHSRYREDPLGRLERTASFIGTTTYGSRADARRAIERVRAVHSTVHGISNSGVAYRADDPHLLEWVHVAELSMFLAAVRTYGPQKISATRADQYVAEMAQVGADLGVVNPPMNLAELDDRLKAYRDELELIDVAREARNFVVRGVSRRAQERVVYATLVSAAIGVLPSWARRQLELPNVPGADTLIVRPAATAMLATLRLAVPPAVS